MTAPSRPLVLAFLAALAAGAAAQQVSVPNGSFEDGKDAPAEWRRAGAGQWLDGGAADGRRAVAATGTGADNTCWLSAPLKLEPSTLYAVSFQARSLCAGGGTAVSGPAFCNRDLRALPPQWTRYISYCFTPQVVAPDDARLRFGQWHVKGTVAFDDVRAVRAMPVHSGGGKLDLGAGETLRGGEYVFDAPFGQGLGNYSRPLVRHACSFNSNRWCLGTGSEVVYCHQVGDRTQLAGQVQLSVTWHAAGELVVEAGADGRTWREIGTIAGLGAGRFDVPKPLLPARKVWVRLTARAKAGSAGPSLQVSQYAYSATLLGTGPSAVGRTHVVTMPRADPRLKVAVRSIGEALPGGANVVAAEVTNASGGPLSGRLSATVVAPEGTETTTTRDVTLKPGAQTLRIGYDLAAVGRNVLRVALAGDAAFTAEAALNVPALHDSSYGQALPGSTDAVKLWWASSGWKISRTRPAPEAAGEAICIRAARNEAEAAQLVIRPARPLNGLSAAAGPLTGPGGKVIPAGNIDLLRVRYVPVTQPTDATGTVGPWPDPLPPLVGPIDLPAEGNQPLWVRLRVPKDAAPGVYAGAIRLAGRTGDGERYRAEVPLRAEVYGFVLPDRMTCTTSFGFSPGNVWRYQKVRDPAQRRTVLGKYLADFSAHHVSPYDPAPLDPLKVTWPRAGDWQGGRRDTAVKHAGKSSLKVEDASTTAQVGAAYGPRVRIPAGGLRLRFWYRSDRDAHRFIVSFNHDDASGKWMSGRNHDVALTGRTTWQELDRTIDRFPAGARSVRLTLWAALWSDDGATTGTVWYDDLSLTDAATGKELVQGGDFEPIPPERFEPRFDWAAWDAAMRRAVDQYHFNSFLVRVPGMGGGSFHARHEPSLLGYGEDAPEYRAAFTNYCRALQEHLRANGWLDEAYVYWFDEPAPKDYAFVANGFRKLKAAAPDLRRMLTEQVEDALVGGPNIWCPVTPNYDHRRAEQRRAHGETFWWYVCTGPKAPYCTLFIDHPATELRVWLWQTWQRRIEGILVWQTNYWTSGTAYPDPARPQDPYRDPMGWVSGYSSKPGQRRPWGNGDGRFIYPPEAAADGRQADTVLDGPVDSIRWEMLRDGIEDYEYLAMLKRLLALRGGGLAAADRARFEALLAVPEDVTTDMTTFTTTPEPIERRRHAVARALEALAR